MSSPASRRRVRRQIRELDSERTISSYTDSVRRKPGTLLPIEISILVAGMELRTQGESEFHGYGAAQIIRQRELARLLTSHGTLYKALE